MPRLPLDQQLLSASSQMGRVKRRRAAQRLQGLRDTGFDPAAASPKGVGPSPIKGRASAVSPKGRTSAGFAGPGRMSSLPARGGGGPVFNDLEDAFSKGYQGQSAENRTTNARAGRKFERIPVQGGEWHLYGDTGELVFNRSRRARRARKVQAARTSFDSAA